MTRFKKLYGELLRFGIVGLINTGLTYGLFLLLLSVTGHLIGYTVAYFTGIVISYVFNNYFVFRTTLSRKSALRFPFVYVIQYGYGWVCLWLLVDEWGMNSKIAMILVIGSSTLLSFVMLKRLFQPAERNTR